MGDGALEKYVVESGAHSSVMVCAFEDASGAAVAFVPSHVGCSQLACRRLLPDERGKTS